jgi:hypothetical protein
MTSASAATPDGRRRLRTIAVGAGYLLAIGAALQVGRALVDNPTTHVMIGAMVVALVSGHAGLRAEEGGSAARRRAVKAAGLTLLPVIAAVAVAVLLGARLPIAPPGMSAIFGVAEAIAVGYVAEAWLHGLPMMVARRARVPRLLAVVYAVAAGVGAQIFTGPVEPAGVSLAIASGAFFTLLWLRTGDAWAPVTGHVVWVWSCDGLLRGDLLDLGPGAGRLTHALEAKGAVAWVATAVFAVLAWAVATELVPFTRAATENEDDDEDDVVDEDDDEDDVVDEDDDLDEP